MSIRSLPLDRWTQPVLDDGQRDAIHEASLRVLERTGVAIDSRSLRDDLARQGAMVERGSDRVRFPAGMVESALRLAPTTYTLAGRDPADDLPLDRRHGYLSIDGSAADILDPETGERRASTGADLAVLTRLGDALPEIAFVWQGVVAGDAPAAVRPLHELRIQLANTSKHIQLMTTVTRLAAEGAVEMAAAAAGGRDALRQRPIVSSFQCSLSPLAFDGESLEAALAFARAGIPSGFVVMSMACATAPATRAGLLVQSNAEILAGVTILETLVPGAKTFYGACPTVMDLRSGRAACGGPEDALFQVAHSQLGHSYGLPTSIGTFAPGAKRADWQAGLEDMLSGLASLIGGADMLSGAGLLNEASLFSLEELVIDAEIFALLCRLADPLRVDADGLADEVIEAVGPRGHYLAEKHTRAHMRRLWMPTLFDRRSWDEWATQGPIEVSDRARERVRSLLASHVPARLPDGVPETLDRIVAEYEAAAVRA